MNEQEILKKLKNLKSITPEQKFIEESRTLILASSHKSETALKPAFSIKYFTEMARISAMVGAVAILLLFLMGGISYINKNFSPLGLEGLNQKGLVTEAKDINNSIEITLKQIKYFDQSNQNTIIKINEAAKNQPISTPIIATSTSDQPATSTSTSTEDISNFLISAVNSTTTEESTNNLLDKISQ